MTYLLLKLIHIICVVIFLGNISIGLFWAAKAKQSRDFQIITFSFENIIKSDRWFTLPGVFGIIISGFALAILGKFPILSTSWIFWPFVLFSVSGVIFGVWLAPLQRQIQKFTHDQTLTEKSWQQFVSLYKKWELWGLAALITPILAFAIVILKPVLPSLF